MTFNDAFGKLWSLKFLEIRKLWKSRVCTLYCQKQDCYNTRRTNRLQGMKNKWIRYLFLVFGCHQYPRVLMASPRTASYLELFSYRLKYIYQNNAYMLFKFYTILFLRIYPRFKCTSKCFMNVSLYLKRLIKKFH